MTDDLNDVFAMMRSPLFSTLPNRSAKMNAF
jgi:hypothetical protein